MENRNINGKVPLVVITRYYNDKKLCNSGILSYSVPREIISEKIINNEKFKTPNYPLSNDYENFLYYDRQEVRFCTLELPYLDNEKDVSCIPANCSGDVGGRVEGSQYKPPICPSGIFPPKGGRIEEGAGIFPPKEGRIEGGEDFLRSRTLTKSRQGQDFVNSEMTEGDERSEEQGAGDVRRSKWDYILTKHFSPKFKDNCFKVWQLNEEKYQEFELDQLQDNYLFPESYVNSVAEYGSLRDYFVANSLNRKFMDNYGPILLEVEGRSDILIHAGNTLADTQGCILVGLYRNKDGSIVAGKSRVAIDIMKETLPDVCYLRIINSRV